MFTVRVTGGLRRSDPSGSRELDRSASAPREVVRVSGQLGVAEQANPVGESVGRTARADSAGAGSGEADSARRGAATLKAAEAEAAAIVGRAEEAAERA